MPEVSPDGKVVRIRLKAGVRYVDDPCFRATGGKGREVVASDVVFCIKRLMDLRSDTKGSWILAGKVEGLDAFSKASAKAPPDPARDRYLEEEGFPAVSGLVEVDAHTVEFRSSSPTRSSSGCWRWATRRSTRPRPWRPTARTS
jgi:ABC-type transport system substrate-binding protein